MTPEPLLDLYCRADSDMRLRGRNWYPEAHRRLKRLAREHNRPLEQVAAVFAIVSVAAQLRTNFKWTEEVLRGERRGGRYPNVQGPRVAAALASSTPETCVTGPKVSAFYRAIMGDEDALVLDRWAARAAGWDSPRHDFGVKARREMEACYRVASGCVNETMRDFQAIVWIALRETKPITRKGKTLVPRLWDITTAESQDSEIGGTE